jgi:hypothetical protein
MPAFINKSDARQRERAVRSFCQSPIFRETQLRSHRRPHKPTANTPPDTEPKKHGRRRWTLSGFVSPRLAQLHSRGFRPLQSARPSSWQFPLLKRNLDLKIPIPIPIPIHSRGLTYSSSCNFALRLSLKFYRYDGSPGCSRLAGERARPIDILPDSRPPVPVPSMGRGGRKDDAWPGSCYDSAISIRPAGGPQQRASSGS